MNKGRFRVIKTAFSQEDSLIYKLYGFHLLSGDYQVELQAQR